MTSFSQNKPTDSVPKPTISYKTNYGLRLGIDVSKPIKAIFDNNYKGLELVGDYRISKKWYIATELGYEQQFTEEDYLKSDSFGSYIKAGANYNTYNNWLDMNNEIYVGARYGFAVFNQSLNGYTPNVNGTYFPSKPVVKKSEETGLTAHWGELQLGIKTETFKNLFLGFHVSYKIAIAITQQKKFETLYAPGFNRIYSTNTGFGFNYTISYLIPFSKK